MVIGDHGPYPGLVASVRSGMLDRLAGLLASARAAKVPVVYSNFVARPAPWVASRTPQTDRAALTERTHDGPPVDWSVVPELAPHDGDLILERAHGMSGFSGTELDYALRNLGVETIVLTGVSANLGVIGTTIEAVNRGYRVVVPADCVAADPPEYGEQMLRNTYRNVCYVSSAEAVAQAFNQ